ncbi:mannose-1-phosphate guanylyltransferase/mannose-6-phosphate isomerase [Erwinia aphidicola]|jgi:mannose-1-phosphate guanylyltransferase|uniref:mannose-1-phosphate guanylyltransferase/mannose-6-phosphate isomerase n=1 Tax=Erwinia aphidicola TaxID=68334 RepID=UPI0017468907|nr:mannose-1-phosphate guanylyltransferase/mannose-6-phosphate isomerase [Erwinia aphidicola]MBD1375527.1 mannose-1-phosphate guanylyltransferase/mannose-6-phosphate isomerase [Erwinia aphidicola]
MIIPVIMAGGSGSRLWPLSRALFPKQFLSLFSEKSLLQDTLLRSYNLAPSHPIIICNNEHRFLVKEQLLEVGINDAEIVLEPSARNTAPAIALAAFSAMERSEDAVILVMPSDHLIGDNEIFSQKCHIAYDSAMNGKLVTFGIEATAPETGYGYISAGDELEPGVFAVKNFFEKPDIALAHSYISSGDYTWNSGIFLFKASTYLSELKKYRLDIWQTCQEAFAQSWRDLDFIRLPTELFSSCPAESIDYAVMERTDNAVVIPVNFAWSDIGSWSALWDMTPKNDCGNVIHGDIYTYDSHNNYLSAQDKFVACIGIDNAVIVETRDAVLIADKDRVQDVKKVVEYLNVNHRVESQSHHKQYRPWGNHETLSTGARYSVKHLIVKPGERSASQIHYHRSEHWIVVSGTACVVRGEETFILSENQSTYIPIGVPHYFENPGKITLEIIEVQTGSYLAENDVLRNSEK